MNEHKSLLWTIAAWWEERRAVRSQVSTQRLLPRNWLPNPGNIVFTVTLFFALLWAQNAGAFTLATGTSATTSTIAYQGRLADSDGNPLTDTVNMSFRLYNAAAGSEPLWTEQWTGSNGVQVSDGLFNVMLGSLTPIPQDVIAGNSTLFLGITVGTDDEMSPRVQLGSVPFAVQALTVPDGSITPDKLAFAAQPVDCYPPTPAFDLATGSNWSGDLFSCDFDAPTSGFMYLSLQGHQRSSNSNEGCAFGIFVDGKPINSAPRDLPSLGYLSTWHPVFMSDTVSVNAGSHVISIRTLSGVNNTCSIHDPDINGIFVPASNN